MLKSAVVIGTAGHPNIHSMRSCKRERNLVSARLGGGIGTGGFKHAGLVREAGRVHIPIDFICPDLQESGFRIETSYSVQ